MSMSATELISRLQMLGEDFETEVEGWQVDRVRDELRTDRYFHGVYYPKAFQIDGRKYVHGLAALARRAGARIFEDTPVVSIDPSGIRKRIVTPSARLRASHIVLAGNIHLGAPLRRLSETLLPVWRYAARDRAARRAACRGRSTFQGSVTDTDGIDHFRDRRWRPADVGEPGNHLGGAAAAFCRRHRAPDPHDLSRSSAQVEIAEIFGGAIGQTVHGMPQIGQLRKGLWVASGFGRQGLNTSAMAGPADRAQHPVGRRALAAVFAVRTGLGRRPDRPGRRICRRDVGTGKFRRRRRAGALSGAGAGPGSASARRGWRRPIARPERRAAPPRRRRPRAATRPRPPGAGKPRAARRASDAFRATESRFRALARK